MDSGYPGHLNIAAAISLSPISGELKIEYSGMSTEKTPIDVSNNILFNLAGHKTGNVSGLSDSSFSLLRNFFLIIKRMNFVQSKSFNISKSCLNIIW